MITDAGWQGLGNRNYENILYFHNSHGASCQLYYGIGPLYRSTWHQIQNDNFYKFGYIMFVFFRLNNEYKDCSCSYCHHLCLGDWIDSRSCRNWKKSTWLSPILPRHDSKWRFPVPYWKVPLNASNRDDRWVCNDRSMNIKLYVGVKEGFNILHSILTAVPLRCKSTVNFQELWSYEGDYYKITYIFRNGLLWPLHFWNASYFP